jgi:segregation and condensation protein A
VLVALEGERYLNFVELFDPAEGRVGITVTFLAILELLKESLIDVVQAEAYGPIHVRAAQADAPRNEAAADEPADEPAGEPAGQG